VGPRARLSGCGKYGFPRPTPTGIRSPGRPACSKFRHVYVGWYPRTVKPVASRYTDNATRPTNDGVVAQYWAVCDMGYNFIFHVCLCHLAVISHSCGRCIQTSFVRNSGFIPEVLLSVHRILDECIWDTGKMIVYT
jgi:hypothetical protein